MKNPNIYRHQLKLVFILVVLVVHGCAGYVPGQRSYWDDQVRQMCARDGGVRIFEYLRIKRSEIDLLGRIDGKIGVPVKDLADPRSPAFAVLKTDYIKSDGNPLVWRAESSIVRRHDGSTVARWVAYTRSGGDFPSHAHESYFTCPDLKSITAALQTLFLVEEDSK